MVDAEKLLKKRNTFIKVLSKTIKENEEKLQNVREHKEDLVVLQTIIEKRLNQIVEHYEEIMNGKLIS